MTPEEDLAAIPFDVFEVELGEDMLIHIKASADITSALAKAIEVGMLMAAAVQLAANDCPDDATTGIQRAAKASSEGPVGQMIGALIHLDVERELLAATARLIMLIDPAGSALIRDALEHALGEEG